MGLRGGALALVPLLFAARAGAEEAAENKPWPRLTVRAIPRVELTESGLPVLLLVLTGDAQYPDGARLDVKLERAGADEKPLEGHVRVNTESWHYVSPPLSPGDRFTARIRFDPAAQPPGVVAGVPEGLNSGDRSVEIAVGADAAVLPRHCPRRAVAFQAASLGLDPEGDSVVLTWRAPGEEDWNEGELRVADGIFTWTAPADGVYELRFFSPKHFDRSEPKESKTGVPWTRTIRVIVEADGDAGGLPAIGRALMSEGKWRQAEAVLRLAAEADPSSAEAQADLGHARIELGDFDGAELALTESIRLDPQADAMFNLAVARTRLEKYGEAWKAAKLALKWAGEGTRLLERAANLALELAPRLDEPREAWVEVDRWAPGTAAGRKAAKLLGR
ncbi:MAG: tetratricopeptide repeat protein [Planctomycetes bacterium]|nr:tetratricopeptide repeat protein [Planctomycetota bacterium]